MGPARPLLALLLAVAPLVAHEGPDAELARLDEQLEHAPSAAGFVERAELRQLSGNWMGALSDLRRAEELDPELDGLDLGFARVLAGLGSWSAASAYVDEHLARRPDDRDALRLSGQVLLGLGRPQDAALRFERALALVELPDPEFTLAAARAWARAERTGRALAVLDRALERLGPVPGLELEAVELERSAGDPDAALVRVERLLAVAARHERWYVLRAELEQEAGRPRAALASIEQAREAIRALRPDRRRTPAVLDLTARLDALEHALRH